ncbi:hypothetical protein AB0M02_24320 [Actinoplanes sp. NPDC051861]|uniref:hypothetical protein n=1 Tax=Actinoplanes sp. NPDC051861 TaxID=3155170 RepID=UPI0034271062
MLFDQALDRAFERHGESPEYERLERLAAWAEGLIVLLVALVAIGAGRLVRDPLIGAARALSGGTSAGMAAAGWLVAVAPFAALGLVLQRTRGMERRYRAAFGIVPALLAGVLIWFAPFSGRYLAGVVSGPGGSGFVTGLYWGLGVVALALLATPFVIAIARSADRAQTITALSAAVALISLAIAVLRAW